MNTENLGKGDWGFTPNKGGLGRPSPCLPSGEMRKFCAHEGVKESHRGSHEKEPKV